MKQMFLLAQMFKFILFCSTISKFLFMEAYAINFSVVHMINAHLDDIPFNYMSHLCMIH